MNPSQHAEELVAKTLRCEDVYGKYALNEMVIEVLDMSIQQSMVQCWGANKETTLQHLAFHATSLLRLQVRDMLFKETPSASARQAETKQQASRRKSFWANPRTNVQNVEFRSTSGAMNASRHFSGTPAIAIDSCTSPTNSVS